MAELKEEAKIYIIPENFVIDGKISIGSFSVEIKRLIEGAILSLPTLIVAFIIVSNIPDISLTTEIACYIGACALPLIAAIIGFNDDTIFNVIKHFKSWKKNSTSIVYNKKPILLKQDPIQSMFEKPTIAGIIGDRVRVMKKEKEENQKEFKLVEGEDFVFEESNLAKLTKESSNAKFNISQNNTKDKKAKTQTLTLKDMQDDDDDAIVATQKTTGYNISSLDLDDDDIF